jgi:hypothetical protein
MELLFGWIILTFGKNKNTLKTNKFGSSKLLPKRFRVHYACWARSPGLKPNDAKERWETHGETVTLGYRS